jgi:hypothetical protein
MKDWMADVLLLTMSFIISDFHFWKFYLNILSGFGIYPLVRIISQVKKKYFLNLVDYCS